MTALLLCVFITAGAVGPAAVFWVYISEIYPSRTRGVLMSLATAAHRAADFLVATTFLPLVQVTSGTRKGTLPCTPNSPLPTRAVCCSTGTAPWSTASTPTTVPCRVPWPPRA
ncbi:MFS transporter [Streptomyces sp. 8N616]|uniref:MFS transporter n=1 Tax=Streptomyces sp. 8N616 TaxID=3457414 RepID=UPI003FCEE71C